MAKLRKHTFGPAWIKISEDRMSFSRMPEREAIVKQIFELSLAGLGCYTIANQLNANEVPVFGPSPKWDQSTIHNLLCNRATIGEHQRKKVQDGKRVPVGDPIPGFYPAAIDESLFLRVQAARQTHLASGRGRKGPDIANLFRGVLTCAYCGGPMQSRSRTITCSRVLEQHACIRKAWSYGNFEASFFEFVMKLQSDTKVDALEREDLAELAKCIRALPANADPFNARLSISTALRAAVSELDLASAGATPVPINPTARIRLDDPERYFEVRLRSGSTHTYYPERRPPTAR
jgi:hypothetical protein